ncbi:MAG: hypothetical protein GY798_32695 [Hyphomicrobiales bacterium]|nr:hypothetical protein [Hyphomicrobiales bacterium]
MKIIATFVFALTMMMAASASHSQEPAAVPDGALPNLMGTWVVVHSEGAFGIEIVTTLPRAELIIDMQSGPVFAGSAEYELGSDDPDFQVGDEAVRMATEPFTGMIGWDNKSLTMVERGDTSVWTGTLLNAETMALVYYEAGEHAFIARQILVRR